MILEELTAELVINLESIYEKALFRKR